MKRLLFLALALAVLFMGCAANNTTLQIPSACDGIQGPSMLCDIAAEKNVNLSVVADGLGLANIIAIERGMYTKDQAKKVLSELRAFMDGPVSYAAFRAEMTQTIEAYPYLLDTADRYLNTMVSSQIMYKADADLIRGWLDRLIKGLG